MKEKSKVQRSCLFKKATIFPSIQGHIQGSKKVGGWDWMRWELFFRSKSWVDLFFAHLFPPTICAMHDTSDAV